MATAAEIKKQHDALFAQMNNEMRIGGGLSTKLRYQDRLNALMKQYYQARNAENKSGGKNKTAPLSPMDSINKNYETAKKANESRYQDILSQYGDIEEQLAGRDPAADYAEAAALASKNYDTGMGFLTNAGEQQKSDIRQQGHNTLQKFRSNAISRGMNVPGLMTSVERGINRDTTANLNRLQEGLNRQKLGAHTTLSNNQLNVAMNKAQATGQSYRNMINSRIDKLRFMERKTDGYPNINQIASYYAR
jgi:hypothetical protein